MKTETTNWKEVFYRRSLQVVII